jgi:hypothetical protein
VSLGTIVMVRSETRNSTRSPGLNPALRADTLWNRDFGVEFEGDGHVSFRFRSRRIRRFRQTSNLRCPRSGLGRRRPDLGSWYCNPCRRAEQAMVFRLRSDSDQQSYIEKIPILTFIE